MTRVMIIGCGIIGAMTAYELSQLPGLEVTVLDQQPPAQGSTGAALGVLMAVISHKTKGRNWRLRETSLRRYETLIPELEAALGRPLPYNRCGLLNLCFDPADLPRWQSLQTIRQSQGYRLELWSPEQLAGRCPQLELSQVAAAIYSPHDRQVEPVALTLALVAAATQQGAHFDFERQVVSLAGPAGQPLVQTTGGAITADCVVITAGLGSFELTQSLQQPVPIGPVLGQALQVQLPSPLGDPAFQPAINADDIHLVPLEQGRYWVGATVEFPPETDLAAWLAATPAADRLEEVWQRAIAQCPALAAAAIVRTWSGLRPRPQAQAAPVITPLPGYENVYLAAGHYRNGVLLAPATALQLRDWLR